MTRFHVTIFDTTTTYSRDRTTVLSREDKTSSITGSETDVKSSLVRRIEILSTSYVDLQSDGCRVSISWGCPSRDLCPFPPQQAYGLDWVSGRNFPEFCPELERTLPGSLGDLRDVPPVLLVPLRAVSSFRPSPNLPRPPAPKVSCGLFRPLR